MPDGVRRARCCRSHLLCIMTHGQIGQREPMGGSDTVNEKAFLPAPGAVADRRNCSPRQLLLFAPLDPAVEVTAR